MRGNEPPPELQRTHSKSSRKPELRDFVTSLPKLDDPLQTWTRFFEDCYLDRRRPPDQVREVTEAVLAIFNAPPRELPEKAAYLRKVTDAFVEVAYLDASRRFPEPMERLFDAAKWKIGFSNAFYVLKNTCYEPMKSRMALYAAQSLAFESDPEGLSDLVDLLGAEKGRCDPIVLDGFFSRKVFTDQVEEAFRLRMDDRRFYADFLRLFELKAPPIKQTVYRGLSASRVDLREFEYYFRSMRYGAIMADFHKFPLEVIEEKMRDPADLQILFEILRSKKPDKMDEAYSLFVRHNLDLKRSSDRQAFANPHKFLYLEPSLHKVDAFAPLCVNLKATPSDQVLTMQFFGLTKNDVAWVSSDAGVRAAAKEMTSSRMCGFDSEFYRASYAPFEKQQMALIQIYDGKRVYLFDCLALKGSREFGELLKDFFRNPYLIKVGLGLSSDMEVLGRFVDGESFKQASVLDLARGCKHKQLVSLKSLVEKVFNKELCKFEQASAWDRRPLRLSQIHYASLDAVACFHVAQSLSDSKWGFDLKELTVRAQELADTIMAARKEDASHPKDEVAAAGDQDQPQLPAPHPREDARPRNHMPAPPSQRPETTSAPKTQKPARKPLKASHLSKKSAPFHAKNSWRGRKEEEVIYVPKPEPTPE